VANKVLESLHDLTAERCVDVFVRDDGTFGYEEYRRDYEDGGMWFPLHRYSGQVFRTQAEALAHARATVRWLLVPE